MTNTPEIIVRISAVQFDRSSCLFLIEKEIDCEKHVYKLSFNLEYMFEYIEDSVYEQFIKNVLKKFLHVTEDFELIYNVEGSDFQVFLKSLKMGILK